LHFAFLGKKFNYASYTNKEIEAEEKEELHDGRITLAMRINDLLKRNITPRV
jgi:hypothetical protein